MKAISELKRLLVFCLVIIGSSWFCSGKAGQAEIFVTSDGYTFDAVLHEVGVGAVGVHRERGKLMAMTSFYRAMGPGIFVEIKRPWLEYDRFKKSYDRAVCLRHIAQFYRKELGWRGGIDWAGRSPGETFEEQLTACLKRRQLIYQMRKSGSKTRWYYTRFARFQCTNGYMAYIPLSAFQGTPQGPMLQRRFDSKVLRETEAQIVLGQKNRMRIARMQVKIFGLAPIGPNGPVFAALGPGQRRFQIAVLRQQIREEKEILRYRMQYVSILQGAR